MGTNAKGIIFGMLILSRHFGIEIVFCPGHHLAVVDTNLLIREVCDRNIGHYFQFLFPLHKHL